MVFFPPGSMHDPIMVEVDIFSAATKQPISHVPPPTFPTFEFSPDDRTPPPRWTPTHRGGWPLHDLSSTPLLSFLSPPNVALTEVFSKILPAYAITPLSLLDLSTPQTSKPPFFCPDIGLSDLSLLLASFEFVSQTMLLATAHPDMFFFFYLPYNEPEIVLPTLAPFPGR